LTGQRVYVLHAEEIVRRGLRRLLESSGFTVVGESGSACNAIRRIPALRPDLVILDDDLADGSGAGVCRDVSAADPHIRCVLLTREIDETVLIDSILTGAWGCLSQQDDNTEQLRLIRRALDGQTAYSRRFLPGIRSFGPGPESFVLRNLGTARRTQAAVLVRRTLRPAAHPAHRDYRSSRFPDLIAEVTAALLNCTSEAGTARPTNGARAGGAHRLADALAAARNSLSYACPLPNGD